MSDELKGTLPPDFPGLAALNAAGINTYAQLRKAGEVTQIPGIGTATAAKITEAMDARTPADQLAEGEPVTNPGGPPGDEIVAAGKAEAAKSGAERNLEFNHALDETSVSPVEQEGIAKDISDAEKIANSGLVVAHSAVGLTVGLPSHYAGKVDSLERGPTVSPIGTVPPRKGMTVYDPDGEVYAISEELHGDSSEWMRVASPSGKRLIR